MPGESWPLEKAGSKQHANYTLEWSLPGTSCSYFKIQLSGPLAYRLGLWLSGCHIVWQSTGGWSQQVSWLCFLATARAFHLIFFFFFLATTLHSDFVLHCSTTCGEFLDCEILRLHVFAGTVKHALYSWLLLCVSNKWSQREILSCTSWLSWCLYLYCFPYWKPRQCQAEVIAWI